MTSATKAVPMTKDEVLLLVELVAANKIINNKSTNATTNRLKEQAWQTLSNSFNSSVNSAPRTQSQIRLKWDNLKKSARKRCANIRASLNETGGCKDYFPPNEILDRVASVLESTSEGFNEECGDETTEINQSQIMDGVEDESVEVPISGAEHGDSDETCCDVGEAELLRDIQIRETPSPDQKDFFLYRGSECAPDQKDFFLNRAGGRGSLAKRRHMLQEDRYKALINRENAMAEYLMAKKRKIDLESQEKSILIDKLKIELHNAKLENMKLKLQLNLLK